MKEAAWNDHRIELIIGTLLRVGVLSAAGIVTIGGVLYLARHGTQPIHVRTFHGEDPGLRGLTGVVTGAFNGSGRAIIQLGLLLLIATPVARVLFSAVAFALERDYLYVGITLIVLAILTYSLLGPAR